MYILKIFSKENLHFSIKILLSLLLKPFQKKLSKNFLKKDCSEEFFYENLRGVALYYCKLLINLWRALLSSEFM